MATDPAQASMKPIFERGERLRITFEAEVLRTEEASGGRGVARVILRAGAGMNDSVWLVREPGYGEVVSVECVGRESS